MRLISIGSSRSCNICIPSDYVSSYHAEILLLDNGDIFLTDCSSRNGTFLNGKRIDSNVEVPVRRGDKIEFDDVVLNWSNVPVIPLPDPSTVRGIYGVGKNPRNRYQLSGNAVSRFHATFKEMRNGKWFINDHSKNGTFVNGQRIPMNQDFRITSKDTIMCGNVPCPNPIPPTPPIGKILLYAGCSLAAAAAIVLLVLFLPGRFGHKTDPSKATVLVRQTYNIKVVFEDDPVKEMLDIKDWYIGIDDDGDFELSTSSSDAAVGTLSGTAFFINESGLMMTNRHVTDALWADSHYEGGKDHKDFKAIVHQARLIYASLLKKQTRSLGVYSKIDLWEKSPFHLEVANSTFRVMYSGRIYSSYSEADYASLVAQSKDEEVDMALIRLNSNKTPEFCDYFDLNRAIVKTSDLKMDMTYYTIGYPAGISLAMHNTDDGKMESTSGMLHLCRVPSRYTLTFQGDQTVGGCSGAPIYDKNKRLVGVLWGGYSVISSTTACPIIHGMDMVRVAIENEDSFNRFKSSNVR